MSETDSYASVDHTEYSPPAFKNVKFKKKRRCKYTIALVTITSVCVNIGLFVVFFLHQHNTNHDEEKSSKQQAERKWLRNSVCVECRILGSSRDQALSSESVQLLSLRNEHLCCLPDAQSLWILLNLFEMKTRMKMQHKAGKSMVVPSAHLYLDSLEGMNNYKWSDEYGFGAAHVTNLIQFINGRYHIDKSGLYNVYSFITLKRRTASNILAKIHHSVMRISHTIPHNDVVLQRVVELPRQGATFNTSYLRGIVRLDSQDELYVAVSDLPAVYKFAPANFFGLHLLQEHEG